MQPQFFFLYMGRFLFGLDMMRQMRNKVHMHGKVSGGIIGDPLLFPYSSSLFPSHPKGKLLQLPLLSKTFITELFIFHWTQSIQLSQSKNIWVRFLQGTPSAALNGEAEEMGYACIISIKPHHNPGSTPSHCLYKPERKRQNVTFS